MENMDKLFELQGWKKYEIDNGFVGEPVRKIPQYAKEFGSLQIQSVKVRLHVHENLWYEHSGIIGLSLHR